MTVVWIALGIVALAGAFIVIRALARVAAAAKDLQRNVMMLNKHVTAAIQNMGADVQELNESVDGLRRHSTDTVPEGARARPERTERG